MRLQPPRNQNQGGTRNNSRGQDRAGHQANRNGGQLAPVAMNGGQLMGGSGQSMMYAQQTSPHQLMMMVPPQMGYVDPSMQQQYMMSMPQQQAMPQQHQQQQQEARRNPKNEPLPVYRATVKHISDKGFGFVDCPGAQSISEGRDIHLHQNEVVHGNLEAGMEVYIILGQNNEAKLTGKLVPKDGVFSGSIKHWDHQRGFGFIECDEAHRLFDTDVFLHSNDLEPPECQVGTKIYFLMKLNDKNQPQAIRLYNLDGIVKRRQKFMFIEHPDVREQFGKDAFVADQDRPELAVLEEGAQVSFKLTTGPTGQPQALDIQHGHRNKRKNQQGQKQKQGGSQKSYHKGGKQEMSTDTFYHGNILSMGQKFGFISCEEAQKCYGSDVYLNQRMHEDKNLSVGDAVMFKIQINDRGQPQVTEIRKRGRQDNAGANQQAKRQR